jgi:hypothetical protein
MLTPLAATPAHMARYVKWLGQLGIVNASSLQPYFSAVNGFFKGHRLEMVTLGDLVTKVRKRLPASHLTIDETLVREHMPASIVVQALRMAQALRIQLTEVTTCKALHVSPTCEKIRLLQVCTALVVMYF